MKKLHLFTDEVKHYWEMWANKDGSFTVHWGEVGDIGMTKEVKGTPFQKASKLVQEEMVQMFDKGFDEVETLEIIVLTFVCDSALSTDDLGEHFTHKLNEVLGWRGLGHCDSFLSQEGALHMECQVVDKKIATRVIHSELPDLRLG